MTGDQWIAVAGVGAGAVGTVGGLVFALVNGRAERGHSERLARSARLHEQRVAAYAELGRFLERERLYLVRTEPVFGPLPDPPEPLDDDEWTQLTGVVVVSMSPEVLAVVNDAQSGSREFAAALLTYRGIVAQNGPGGMVAGAGQTMHAAREAAIAAIDGAERVMREELAAL